MDSQHIFDVFGRQITNKDFNESVDLRNEFDSKIEQLKVEFSDGVKDSIDKNDVVIKEQFEKPLKLSENIEIVDSKDLHIKSSLNVKGSRISGVSKGIYTFDVIVKEQLDDFIKTFEVHQQEYLNFERHVKDFVNEVYQKFVELNGTV